jgi:hypothetical protein
VADSGVTKARLVEVEWKGDKANDVQNDKALTVQFNPASLKLSFANKSAGGDQAGGNSKQHVGSGTTKMTVELLFDTTKDGSDVRKQTEKVAYFIKPKDKKKPAPPGIGFYWGTFIFRGVVESMDETIDYFSAEGVPLRATIGLSLSQQDIKFDFGKPGPSAQDTGAGGGSAANSPGQTPMEPARPGDSVQSMAGRNGNSSDWKSVAAANNIDDPLRLPAGSLLDMNAGIGGSAGAAIGGGIAAGASFSAGASASLSAGASADLGFSAGIGGGAGFSAGAGASAGFGAGASAGASAGFGAGASAGFGAGASAGFGAGASAGFGAGASADFGAGADFGADANAEASFTAGGSASASAGFNFNAR